MRQTTKFPTALTVSDYENMKKQSFANFTEHKRYLESRIELYEERMEKLLIEKALSESRRKKSELQSRFEIIRELQRLTIIELKGLRK